MSLISNSSSVVDLTHAETLIYLYANPHGGKPLELEVEARGLPSVDVREMFFLKSIQMVEGSGVHLVCGRSLSYSRPHQAGTITPTAASRASRGSARTSLPYSRPVECQRRDAHRSGLAIEVRWFGNK
jgi:hypothetical protein